METDPQTTPPPPVEQTAPSAQPASANASRPARRSRRALWLPIFGFLAGVVVGALLLGAIVSRPADPGAAQRRALQILDRTPVAADTGDNRIVAAVHRIEPAVVNIDTAGRRSVTTEDGNSYFIEPPDQEVRGKGSGVILTPDGFIVTNNHVVEGASRIQVTLMDNRPFVARLVGRDPQTDLAVIKIDATGLPTADLGDSERVQVGEWSIAVGNPLGLGSTVTVGVISALNRRNLQIDEGRILDGAIQTDAAINRGNSGGALANTAGQLIGINTAILSSGPMGGSIGLGFAIPCNTVRRVARMLILHGSPLAHVPGRPWLGVSYGPVPEDVAAAAGLSGQEGVYVERAIPEGPAALGGVRDDDILLTIDGRKITDTLMVRELMLSHHAGDAVAVHLYRLSDHRAHDCRVTLQERPESYSAQ